MAEQRLAKEKEDIKKKLKEKEEKEAEAAAASGDAAKKRRRWDQPQVADESKKALTRWDDVATPAPQGSKWDATPTPGRDTVAGSRWDATPTPGRVVDASKYALPCITTGIVGTEDEGGGGALGGELGESPTHSPHPRPSL